MDVPDIQLVLQWRATCKLSVLWQQFGHAVPDRSLQGTAILFAEKEFFDDERVAKATRKLSRKRKGDHLPNPSMPKRHAMTNTSNSSMPSPSPPVLPAHERFGVDDESDSRSGDEEDETRVENSAGLDDLRYRARASAGEVQTWQKQSKAKWNLDFAMDYLINAEKRAGLKCRRKVFDVCFDNNNTGEKIYTGY